MTYLILKDWSVKKYQLWEVRKQRESKSYTEVYRKYD